MADIEPVPFRMDGPRRWASDGARLAAGRRLGAEPWPIEGADEIGFFDKVCVSGRRSRAIFYLETHAACQIKALAMPLPTRCGTTLQASLGLRYGPWRFLFFAAKSANLPISDTIFFSHPLFLYRNVMVADIARDQHVGRRGRLIIL